MSDFQLVSLPDGREVACQTATEAQFFYRDIFEDRAYLQGGVSLRDVEYVVDVGANIGMFTLFVASHNPHVTVYAFEPAPPLFAILSENVRRHGVCAHLFDFGLAAEPGAAELTFYPQSSGMSSFHADAEEERAVLRTLMENQLEEGIAGMEEVLAHADDLLDERLREERFRCRLEPLSAVLRAEGIERVDLLKVDVQKAELEVLEGIDPVDWPKIRQVVVEVHAIGDRLEQVTGLLDRAGLEVTVEQDPIYRDSVMLNVFGVRPAPVTAGRGSVGASRRVEQQRRALERLGSRARRGRRPTRGRR